MAIAATQVFSAACLIPAGTDPSTPVTVDCSFPDASVVSIRWRVPPGPSGLMGFQVTSDGAPVIPLGESNYIVADDETAQWDVTGYQDTGSWQVTGYNTDIYDHTVYLDFLTVPPGQDQAAPPAAANTQPITDNTVLSPSPPSLDQILQQIDTGP